MGTEERDEQELGLLRDEGGATYVEYIVLTSTVAIGGATAIAAIGVPLLGLFHYVNMMILLPIP